MSAGPQAVTLGVPGSTEKGGFRALAFVGEELWAQCGTVVHRLFGTRGALVVPEKAQMIRAVGAWIEFRSAALGGTLDERTGKVDGFWLYDAKAERWHTGPWPEALECYLCHQVEREDCVLENPRLGLRFDVSQWAWEHRVHACAPDGRYIALDHRILDLVTGEAVRIDALKNLPELRELPCIGSGGASLRPGRAEALVRNLNGEVSWIVNVSEMMGDEHFEAGIGGMLGMGERPLAWVAARCVAAAFTPDGSKIAFMDESHVWIVDAEKPTDPPLVEFLFEVLDDVEVDEDQVPF